MSTSACNMECSSWIPAVTKDPEVPVSDLYAAEMERPAHDDRKYRLVRLRNGFTSLLVQDMRCGGSAACMVVGVGHMQDPEDMPGMAELCARTLVIDNDTSDACNISDAKTGSIARSLPVSEKEYGCRTFPERAEFWFSSRSSKYEDRLADLAHRLKKPSFFGWLTSFEQMLNTLEEHDEPVDDVAGDRQAQASLHQFLSADGHSWKRCGRSTERASAFFNLDRELKAARTTGSFRAVNHRTRMRLLQWWEQHYCASRMQLCVVGREPVDQQAEMVAKYFASIPCQALEPIQLVDADHPVTPTEPGYYISAVGQVDKCTLEFTFPIPRQRLTASYPFPHAASVLSDILTRTESGSLLPYLRREGWVQDLHLVDDQMLRSFRTICLSLELTDEGERRVGDVAHAVTAYLEYLRSSELDTQAWRFSECRRLQQLQLVAKHPFHRDSSHSMTSARTLARRMHEAEAMKLPGHCILTSGSQEDWEATANTGVLRDLLDVLRVENSRVVLFKKDHPRSRRFHQWSSRDIQVLPLTPTLSNDDAEVRAHRYVGRSSKAARRPDRPQYHFTLPKPNLFASGVDVGRLKQDWLNAERAFHWPNLIESGWARFFTRPSRVPCTPLRQTTGSALWIKRVESPVPEARSLLQISMTSLAMPPPTLRASVMHRVFCLLMDMHLSAELAFVRHLDPEADWSYSHHSSGGTLLLFAWNSILDAFLEFALNTFLSFTVRVDDLAKVKDKLSRSVGNSEEITELLDGLFDSRVHPVTRERWNKEVDAVGLEVMNQYSVQVISSPFDVATRITGQLEDRAAIALQDCTDRLLTTRRSESALCRNSLRLAEGVNYVYNRVLPDFSDSSRLDFYLQLGAIQDDAFRKTQLVAHLLRRYSRRLDLNPDRRQPEFTIRPHTAFPVYGILISYFGPHSPMHAEARIETFLAKFGDMLRSLTDAALDREKHAIMLSPWAPHSANWDHVEADATAFCHDKARVQPRNITKQDLVDFFAIRVHPDSPYRTKFSVHVTRPKDGRRLSPAARETFETRCLPPHVLKALENRLFYHTMERRDEISLKRYKKATKSELRNRCGAKEAKALFKSLNLLTQALPSTHDMKHTPRRGTVFTTRYDKLRRKMTSSCDERVCEAPNHNDTTEHTTNDKERTHPRTEGSRVRTLYTWMTRLTRCIRSQRTL